MRKHVKLLALSLLGVSMLSTTSCNKGYEFDFDPKYFIGMQEHYYEVRGMEPSLTSDFISDLAQVTESKVFRLNVTLQNLFVVTNDDVVKFNTSTKEVMHTIVDDLTSKGVERIIYATDTFLYPYGYPNSHTLCVPDPYFEKEYYIRWLKVNAAAYGLMAAEFPDVRYFEPINEPDYPNNEVVCRNGMIWGTQQAEFMYSQQEEAEILADLIYYERRAIKAVSDECKMSSPAFCAVATTYEYIEFLYEAIESGRHPFIDEDPCDVDPDHYFDIMNLHPYAASQFYMNPLTVSEEGLYPITPLYAQLCKDFYTICCNHGDAEKPHWYTEIGFCDMFNEAAQEVAGRICADQLRAISEELPFVETVIFYKMTDFYPDSYSTGTTNEDSFGIFTPVANPYDTLIAKPVFKSIYSFMHNGSTDYSDLEAKLQVLRDKYGN